MLWASRQINENSAGPYTNLVTHSFSYKKLGLTIKFGPVHNSTRKKPPRYAAGYHTCIGGLSITTGMSMVEGAPSVDRDPMSGPPMVP